MVIFMIDEKLLSLCAQLAKQGKKPNVGLLKGRTKGTFPLPQIIAAVQYWKANPEMEGIQPNDEATTLETEPAVQEENTIAALEQRVVALEKQVEHLTLQVQSLIQAKSE